MSAIFAFVGFRISRLHINCIFLLARQFAPIILCFPTTEKFNLKTVWCNIFYLNRYMYYVSASCFNNKFWINSRSDDMIFLFRLVLIAQWNLNSYLPSVTICGVFPHESFKIRMFKCKFVNIFFNKILCSRLLAS